ncbi:amidohydrolase family protein [Caenimonas sedimenti]|uniref:Amidohydrolase family protein n=1 Tax=Caenimonas sedimenti TaxID=2596921 RepID=A0A562ZVM2_9BURK|nr:TatD family hydrolase [Caenimonas sedimenti]TWO72421.1 amidohydrolase family protein [Caenimonas sedimenti]
MRSLFIAFGLAGAAWCAAAQNIPFVDAHAHLNDAAMQLELMDRHGASHAVVFWGGRSDNASVLGAAREHAPRLIPFASISPERTAYGPLWRADDTRLLDELDALLATGQYRGIGELSVAHFPAAGFPETDYPLGGAMMGGILALARKHKLPVMLHVEITRLAELDALLERHREVTVIWAHGGYTPLFLARRMLERHPNLVYELSARTWAHHPRSPEYTLLRDGAAVWPEWLALVEAQPQRFIVGTDASGRSRANDAMKFESVQNFLRQLSPRARELVGRRNLLQLVGL